MNLINSHPKVFRQRGETQQIFYGLGDLEFFFAKWIRRIFTIPIYLYFNEHVFAMKNLRKREKMPNAFIKRYIDLIFFLNKFLEPHNYIKNEVEKISLTNLLKGRTLLKNLNGVVLSSEIFSQIFPDAKYVNLVRNGFAVLESFIRRGKSIKEIGTMYNIIFTKIIELSSQEKYLTIRFEDLSSSPQKTISEVFDFLDLDINEVKKFRLQIKGVTQNNGKIENAQGLPFKKSIWLSFDELSAFIKKDINSNQINKLTENQKNEFLKYAYKPMKYFGYI